jgi:transcriptional regulator GlxA family with amidase domain
MTETPPSFAATPESARSDHDVLAETLRVGRALQFVRADPGRRWTVEELAREADSSRTVLSERFNAVMGQAPIE